MEVDRAARKHGISDTDMQHAVRHHIREVNQGDDRSLLIGPDTAGRLLETVVVGLDTDEPVIIHADRLRPKFHKYLRPTKG